MLFRIDLSWYFESFGCLRIWRSSRSMIARLTFVWNKQIFFIYCLFYEVILLNSRPLCVSTYYYLYRLRWDDQWKQNKANLCIQFAWFKKSNVKKNCYGVLCSCCLASGHRVLSKAWSRGEKGLKGLWKVSLVVSTKIRILVVVVRVLLVVRWDLVVVEWILVVVRWILIVVRGVLVVVWGVLVVVGRVLVVVRRVLVEVGWILVGDWWSWVVVGWELVVDTIISFFWTESFFWGTVSRDQSC